MTKTTNHSGQLGWISRRRLLQGASALGAAAVVGPLGARVAHAAPKRGGTFRLAMGHGNTSDSYDPATWDMAGIVQDVTIYFRTGYAIAMDERRPQWNPGTPFRAQHEALRAAAQSDDAQEPASGGSSATRASP